MDAEVIYQDKNLAALNKPPGVLFDWVLEKEQAADGRELIPVHRLDKDTSGVILFAKNQETADYLKSLFEGRKIKKTYITLVVGRVKDRTGTIELALARSKKDFKKRVAFGKQGKERAAKTDYKVLKYIGDYTLLEAYPKTGRTHQIRSHFSAIGHPVACDSLYGGKRFLCPAGLNRQFLHAASIEFGASSGEVLRLDAELPPDLAGVLERLIAPIA